MKNLNKVLNIQGCFELPDDFNGGVAEGLRLLATHLEDTNTPGESGVIIQNTNDGEEPTFKDIWKDFKNSDKKFVGGLALAEFRDNKWVKMDKKIP